MTTDTLTSLAYFLAFGFLFHWMMKKGGCGMHSHGHGGHGDHAGGGGMKEGGGGPSISTRDPVCGMEVAPARAAAKRTVMGRTFYLCSAACVAKFDRDPEGYAKRAPSTAASPGREHHQHHGG